jgi:hypothetical protein
MVIGPSQELPDEVCAIRESKGIRFAGHHSFEFSDRSEARRHKIVNGFAG